MQPFRLIFAALIIFLSCLAQAKEIKNEAEAKDLTKRFMLLISLGQIESAFSELKDFIVIPHSELEALAQRIKMQMPLYLSRYGKGVGSEFISEASAGGSVYKLIYIQKFERHVLRWQFIYYKPKTQWILNSVKFDDDISGIF